MFGASLGPQDGAKIDPRSPQDGLQTDLKRDRFLRSFFNRFLVVVGSVLEPFWGDLGLKVPSWGRLGGLLGLQDGPKIDPSSAPKI